MQNNVKYEDLTIEQIDSLTSDFEFVCDGDYKIITAKEV